MIIATLVNVGRNSSSKTSQKGGTKWHAGDTQLILHCVKFCSINWTDMSVILQIPLLRSLARSTEPWSRFEEHSFVSTVVKCRYDIWKAWKTNITLLGHLHDVCACWFLSLQLQNIQTADNNGRIRHSYVVHIWTEQIGLFVLDLSWDEACLSD